MVSRDRVDRSFRRVSACVWAILIGAVVVPTLALARQTVTTQELPAFGMATSAESRGEHAQLYPKLGQAGVTMMRAWPEWSGIQRHKDTWDWSGCDALLASAMAEKIELIGAWWYLTDWACTDRAFPLKDIEDWSNYIYTMVARYRDTVTYWECWNEFNGSFGRRGTVQDYVQLLKHGYAAAKQANPEAKVGISCASTDVTFFEEVITGGAADCFDFVCIHPYESFSVLVKDERVMEFLNVTRSLRAMLDHVDQNDVEIWITECGYPAQTGDEADEALQAQMLVKLYTLSFAQGIDKVFWFEGKGPDYSDGNFGLFRPDWTQRPAYDALCTMTSLLGAHPTYLGWFAPAEKCYGFVFAGVSEPVLVIWSAEPQQISMSGDLIVTELSGESSPIRSGRPIMVDQTPRFIQGMSPEWVAQAVTRYEIDFPWSTYSGSGPAYVTFADPPVEHGLCRLDAFGRVIVGAVDGEPAVRTPSRTGNEFRRATFDVDDAYVGYGDNEIRITVTARRVDPSVSTGINLFYESTEGYRNFGQWWTIPADDRWHQKTYTLDDAQFVNKWGWNFALQNETDGDLWIKEVRVTKVPSTTRNRSKRSR